MNRGAIALAADSASTSIHGRVAKIFDTADKLFELDGRNPVGVMVNAAASFMGVPWETILKLFRRSQHPPQPSLAHYSRLLLDFLASPELLTDQHIHHQFLESLSNSTRTLKEHIDARLKQTGTFADKGEEVIDSILHEVSQIAFADSLSEQTVADLLLHYTVELTDISAAIFSNPALSEALRDKVHRIVCRFLVGSNTEGSGLVIAGYGEDDLFPSLVSHTVRGVLFNRQLQITSEPQQGVDLDCAARIRTFAQGEMVHGFMRGVDPTLKTNISSWFDGLLTKFSNHILANVPNLDAQQMSDLQNFAASSISSISAEFRTEFDLYSQREHIDPVINAVGILPKDQLAVMAETLVALTSFKRRMSSDRETVGGAIDVAVISKGDGFVWIKRKHYFDIQLNPRYAERLRSPTPLA